MAEIQREIQSGHHGHERRDIHVRLVGLSALSLVVLLAGSLALMAWLFYALNVTPEGQGPQGAPLAATPPRPPQPRLQTAPGRDMQAMRQAEKVQLQSYGWVNRPAGIARIPIDQAMAILAWQGLPSWPEDAAPQPADGAAIPEDRQ